MVSIPASHSSMHFNPRGFRCGPPGYLLKRIAFFLQIVWTAATVNFFLPRLFRQDLIGERMIKLVRSGGARGKGIGDMVEFYNEEFGLDKPLWQQYFT